MLQEELCLIYPVPGFLGPSWLMPHVLEPWVGESPGAVALCLSSQLGTPEANIEAPP